MAGEQPVADPGRRRAWCLGGWPGPGVTGCDGLGRLTGCQLARGRINGCVAVKTLRMPEDPDDLVDAIAVAVRVGDDRCIGLLLDRLKDVADLPHLIRLHYRLCDANMPRG